jgi:hypothetical protein
VELIDENKIKAKKSHATIPFLEILQCFYFHIDKKIILSRITVVTVHSSELPILHVVNKLQEKNI